MTDYHAKRQEYYVPLPVWITNKFVKPMLAHEKDTALVHALANVAIFAPTAACLLLAARPSHVLGALYVAALYALFLQRFMLAMHYAAHRPPLQAPANASNTTKLVVAAFNEAPTTLLCAFFGLPPCCYRMHHVAMHHGGANSPAPWRDLSSTATLPRRGARGAAAFVWYWLRSFAALAASLPLWAMRRRGIADTGKTVCGIVAYFGTYFALRNVNAVAANYLIPVPFLISSLALAFGNWSQHALLHLADDGTARTEPHAVAYDCLVCADNARTFNDGYHAVHHEEPTCHWSEMPLRYAQRCEAWIAHLEYVRDHGSADGAPPPPHSRREPCARLAFEGLGFFDIGVLCLLGEYGERTMAKHFVDACDPSEREHDSAWCATELRRRLRPAVTKTAMRH